MPSKKVLEEKKKIVEQLTAEFKQAQSIVFAEYRGLTVEQDTAMRVEMRKNGVRYRVLKNTLSGRALEAAGIHGLNPLLRGPTAIAYSTTDIVAAAKTVKVFADKFDKLTIKGGSLEGRMISAEEVSQLAAIPGRDVLYGQIVFGLMAPIARLAMVIDAIREKAEAGENPQAAAAVEAAAV
jgi:large subunit ribosomal protein L10